MRDLEFGPWAMAGSVAALVAMAWWLPAVPGVASLLNRMTSPSVNLAAFCRKAVSKYGV